MRRITLALDSLPSLREATASADVAVAPAINLAELAGVDAIRLGINEDFKPVSEEDVFWGRRTAHRLELRMTPSQALLRVALDARPERVLLAAPSRDGRSPAAPLDMRTRSVPLAPLIRPLEEAGIPVAVLIMPDAEAVKAAHGEGVGGVELHTGTVVDLPAAQRRIELEPLGDAVRLAAKLRLGISIGGGLGYRNLREVIDAAPAIQQVTVGRAAVVRSLLVGLDQALRDLKDLIA